MDNVLNHPPKAVARLLAPNGIFIPNSIGNSGGLLAGLPRMARVWLMGKGATRVEFVTITVNTASAVARVPGHHAAGKVAIAI